MLSLLSSIFAYALDFVHLLSSSIEMSTPWALIRGLEIC
jgi:hypothetical protein